MMMVDACIANKILGDNIEFGAEPTFFDRIEESHDSFVPYANFIAFTPLAIEDYYSICPIDSTAGLYYYSCPYKDYDLDHGADYIDDYQPILPDQFFSILLGSTNRIMTYGDYYPLYTYPWNTNYKALKRNRLHLKYNVRCIKD